ncbi:oxidoreductase [Lapidilactobacillus concavus DSM 17758]|uniref:Oxidoreductase n=1 Tax=Lapidilactobacillus concavus DSM 17758 TaxID=1423735 RepID=A0A0R1VYD4_9LACO|nr:aldo/keto reductase [Lapidilactobacillus concavus]KRM08089.1 oxidoreductase [Lapidilactobacillus concavus DSM 17758]GEL12969.1 2,5-diketo-D-gluconic acid reductase [Lapidilactobacillus concavus]
MSVLTETYQLANGVQIPKVGFGTWQIPNGDAAYHSVATALKNGYRHIDTAKAYGNEKSVGQAIRDSGIDRKEIFVTSKLPAEIKTYEGALKAFDETMADLDIDYLDLYIIHAPWPWRETGKNCDQGNIEAWKALEKVYKDGRVRAIGVSNFAVRDLKNLFDHSEVTPMVNQIQYYVGFTEPKITSYSQHHGLLVEAYSPLATGQMLNNDHVLKLADKYGVTTAQLAIRFCIENGTLPLPKSVTPEHIISNKELDFTISPEDMAELNDLADTADGNNHNRTQG